MDQLIDILYGGRTTWQEESVRKAFSDVICTRYRSIKSLTQKSNDERRLQLRVNGKTDENAVPFAALLGPGQPTSGAYGGMSLVVFPPDSPPSGPDEIGPPCVIGMVVGTNGLSPDEMILGRPGHARKCAALAQWQRSRDVASFAWAKQDPTRIDMDVPDSVRRELSEWQGAVESYGRVIYMVLVPPAVAPEGGARDALKDAITALFDLFFDERDLPVRTSLQADASRLEDDWMQHLLPNVNADQIARLLASRRFAILQGPPGTGKTRVAYELLQSYFGGNGRVIQFHPGTTYETFIGGLAPRTAPDGALAFSPLPGHLMDACAAARAHPDERHLLVVDEINRADLAKVLGEAILLLEPGQGDREVYLPYDFPGSGRLLRIPENLYILGTMNTADRSIAVLDVAIRRRFAFVTVHAQRSVVKQHAGSRMNAVFSALLRLFIEHAGEEAMAMMPGHSYFLSGDEDAQEHLRVHLRPLLEEYLAQGYVAGFSQEIRSFIDIHCQ